MSGLEALGATTSIIQLVGLAHKVLQSYERVFENRARKHHIAKEIVKDVENLNVLVDQRPDLSEAPDLVRLIMKFCCDLEEIQKKLDAAIPQKKTGLAFKHHIKQWWRSGDIRSSLERIEKEIEGCYKRLMTGGMVQIKLDVHEMQKTINSLEKRMEDFVIALQANPRKAEEIIGIPSMTLPRMQSALNHAKTDLAGLRSLQPENPFLLQKVELLTKALANHAGKATLPVKPGQEDRGWNTSAAEALSQEDGRMSNVRRIILGSPGEDEEDAVSETLRMIRALRNGSSGMTADELGESLRRLGHALGSLRWREQALTMTEWEVKIYRKLAQDHPLAFEPKLSVSLNYLSRCLRDLARENEALLASEEAVELSRKTSKDNQIYQADLAMSLSTLSGRLAAVGHSKDATLAIEESVAIYRQLVKEREKAFLPDLAMALNSLSTRLRAQEHLQPALMAIEESVVIRRKLAVDDPSIHLADLALSLCNLSNRFADNGFHRRALKAINESLTIRRDLVAQRPEVFLEDLATSLNNLSVCLQAVGFSDKALDAIEEARDIYETLWQAFPSVFQAGLSMTLYNVSNQLFINGYKASAVISAMRSVELRLETAHDRPAVFLPKLASSLNLLCDIILHDLCMMFEAHQMAWFPNKYKRAEDLIRRAVSTYQDLARSHPKLSLPRLTLPLDLLDGDMAGNKRLRDAVSAAIKAQRPPSPNPSCGRSIRRTRSSRSSAGSGRSERSDRS